MEGCREGIAKNQGNKHMLMEDIRMTMPKEEQDAIYIYIE